MNSTQRKYLVERIQEKVKIKVRELENTKKETQSIGNYLLHLVLSDKFDLQPIEVIKSNIKEKAIKAISAQRMDNFLTTPDKWGDLSTKNKVILEIKDLFIIPQERLIQLESINKHNIDIDEQINQLKIQAESLETRIMLASDKTLQTMINEVDDMGDISLIDTKIKLLN
jgi:hypothetical protein